MLLVLGDRPCRTQRRIEATVEAAAVPTTLGSDEVLEVKGMSSAGKVSPHPPLESHMKAPV